MCLAFEAPCLSCCVTNIQNTLQFPILGNIVSTVTRLGAVILTNRGSITGRGNRFFSLLESVQSGSGIKRQ